MEIPLLNIVNVLTDLKTLAINTNSTVFMVGRNTVADGLGGFYQWDSTSVVAEDTTYLNVIQSNNITTGRWLRIFQKSKSYPQGTLVNNGGVKALYISGTTDINGEVTINLTDDNTATGNALFTEVWVTTAQSTTTASSVSNAVQSYRKSLAVNLKTVTFGFYKANALTITLGLLYNPFSSIGAGTVIQFKIEGI